MDSWPTREMSLDTSKAKCYSDGRVRCIDVALCADDGQTRRHFFQGERIHFFCEFQVLEHIGIPLGGIEFRDSEGRVIHGKSALEYSNVPPSLAKSGQRFRFH